MTGEQIRDKLSRYSSTKFLGISKILILSFVVGTCVIASASIYVYRQLVEEGQRSEAVVLGRAASIIQEKMNSYIFGLQGMAGVFTAADYDPSEKQVIKYSRSRDYFKNFKGALGFGFIRYVPKERVREYELGHRRETPEFRVVNLPGADPYPEGAALIIEHIEPMSQNFKARGLNVASEENRFVAASRARRDGVPALTGVVRLVQSNAGVAGFLFFLPIYKTGGVPPTEEERLRHFVGLAYSPILVDDIMAEVKRLSDSRLAFFLQDVTNEKLPETIYIDKQLRNVDLMKLQNQTVSAGGRTWKVFGYQEPNLWVHRNPLAVSSLFFLLLFLTWTIIVRFIYSFGIRAEGAENRSAELASWQAGILASTELTMISIDNEGSILTLNSSAHRILGLSASDNANRKFCDVIRTAESDKFSFDLKHRIQAVSSTRVPESFEVMHQRSDGVETPLRLTISPIQNAENLIQGFLVVAQDLTLVREREAELIERSRIISLGEMAGGIAHEINNPLAIILGRLSYLLRGNRIETLSHDELKSEFEKMQKTSDRIAKIIKGLRNFARDGSRDSAEPKKFSQILQDTLEFCEQHMKSKGIELHTIGDFDVVVECRVVEITQVLLNLINNSIYAIQDLSAKWIRVEIFEDTDSIQVLVTDSGRGIPAQTLKKIMMPFYTTKPLGKGTGLGLSISQGIIESHGGTLIYNSSCPNTQFVITLPKRAAVKSSLGVVSSGSAKEVA